jgi:hypothetical protein
MSFAKLRFQTMFFITYVHTIKQNMAGKIGQLTICQCAKMRQKAPNKLSTLQVEGIDRQRDFL